MLCANGQSSMYANVDKEFEEEDGGLINAVRRSTFQPCQTEGEDVEPVDMRRLKGYRTSLQGDRKFGRTKVNEYATECPFTWTNPIYSVSQGHVQSIPLLPVLHKYPNPKSTKSDSGIVSHVGSSHKSDSRSNLSNENSE